MQSSADFRSQNTILHSVKLLRDVHLQEPVGTDVIALGPVDVLDVNNNGKVDLATAPPSEQQPFSLLAVQEPLVGTFNRPQLAYLASVKVRPGQSEVLTQDELQPGWLTVRQMSFLAQGPATRPVKQDEQPLEILAGLVGLNDPAIRFAIDFATKELVFYKPEKPPEPNPSPGLKIETLKPGEGPPARLGSLVTVHYTGTLADGTRFDSSRDRGKPYTLQLGDSGVIKGWHEGLEGVRIGEVRRLTIPPELGYGDKQQGAIPPNSTLTFEIEVLPPQVK